MSEVARRWQGLFATSIRLATRDAADGDDSADRTETLACGFVPIVTEAIPPATAPRAAPAAVIEVKLAGAVVRVAAGMDDATQLTAVLRAVRASASRT